MTQKYLDSPLKYPILVPAKTYQFPAFPAVAPVGNQTTYIAYHGGYSAGFESSAQLRTSSCTVTSISINVTGNTLNSASTITLRKNGAATSLTGTINAGQTGQLNFTGSVDFADGDLLSVEMVLGGTAGQGISIRGGSIVVNI